jgi:hypothetical protein
MFDITLELDKLNRENLEKFRDFLETFSPVCPKDSANTILLHKRSKFSLNITPFLHKSIQKSVVYFVQVYKTLQTLIILRKNY